MSSPQGGYTVHLSDEVVEIFRMLHAQAKIEGTDKALLTALKDILRRLRANPEDVGEPHNRLPALKMKVCCVIVPPVIVDFNVCEDHPKVFIKRIRLLS